MTIENEILIELRQVESKSRIVKTGKMDYDDLIWKVQ